MLLDSCPISQGSILQQRKHVFKPGIYGAAQCANRKSILLLYQSPLPRHHAKGFVDNLPLVAFVLRGLEVYPLFFGRHCGPLLLTKARIWVRIARRSTRKEWDAPVLSHVVKFCPNKQRHVIHTNPYEDFIASSIERFVVISIDLIARNGQHAYQVLKSS